MAMSPDTFLLLNISCGVVIIVVGMIIAINCPLQALSLSFYCKHCRKFCRKLCCRKEKKFTQNIVNSSGSKRFGPSLVEGRPQGHGFYTSGPWSSTETTSTCFGGNETLQHMSLAAQTGLLGGQYLSMISGNNNSSNSESATQENGFGSNGSGFGNSSNMGHGIHGDNSQTFALGGQILCVGCNGAGYIVPVGFGNPSHSNPISNPSLSEAGSSSGDLFGSPDSAMALDDMDADADMMIMCM